MRNKFNHLTGKQWLPFQKSWFKDSGNEELYRKNLQFFTQSAEDESTPFVFYQGSDPVLFRKIALEENLRFTEHSTVPVQFAFLDLRNDFQSIEGYSTAKPKILSTCSAIFEQLEHRRFLAVAIGNIKEPNYFPLAWDLGLAISEIFSLKDEKIGCLPESVPSNYYYVMYFRKDETSKGEIASTDILAFNMDLVKNESFNLTGWNIVRPPRRKKDEILHPAKYPEDLVKMFIEHFTKPGDNVFDPMSGTGSTQMASLLLDRNAWGTELSEFFTQIAMQRCQTLSEGLIPTDREFRILNEDARNIVNLDFPDFDYLITSPPYWDMLNMKGAEYQATRKEKGLQLNYSDNPADLGNIADYEAFVDSLIEIYLAVLTKLKPGKFFTIVVKNIKKKGRNYPFAWHLAKRLNEHGFILLPEVFWCQDDINISPFGFGNTWVSNTFHQYCLTFKKPA